VCSATRKTASSTSSPTSLASQENIRLVTLEFLMISGFVGNGVALAQQYVFRFRQQSVLDKTPANKI